MGKRQRECPTGKTCYPTRGAAETARSRLGHGRCYRCECGSYHTTSKSKDSHGWRQRKHRTAAG